MRRPVLLLLTLGSVCWLMALTGVAQKSSPAKPKPTAGPTLTTKSGDKAPSAEDEAAAGTALKAILELPAPQRVTKLKAFIAANPRSKYKDQAVEALVRARAAWGDAKFRDLDVAGGIEQFKAAVAEAPAKMSDDLYDNYVGQMPATLYVREQPAAALQLARAIEPKINDNPRRLLKLALFYMSLEEGEGAERVAAQAVKLVPSQAEVYMALGSAQRIQLKLDDAAQSFGRAVELAPEETMPRRSLADMKRATGHADEALPLYRALLAEHADDEFAQTGVVMCLFDTGQRAEAEKQLAAALQEDPRSLALLTGAAYWYAAHHDGTHAVEYGSRAVELEPRYVWAQIALARGLVATKQPLAAERSLRFARNYGNFPTLTYELANTLVAAGLYEEAARELAASFSLKDGGLETRLAGRIPARADNFVELLAGERRASIFQATSADTAAGAESLKQLFAFYAVTSTAPVREEDAVAGSRTFVDGADEMRAFRQLYAAGRLSRAGVGWAETQRLTEAATKGVEPALDVPNATAAVMADELFDERMRALANGGSLNIPNVERPILSRILRGRLEDLAGWSLFNQSKPAEAVVRLRRAVNVLPEGSAWWRSSMWHLGAALEASGNGAEALNIYYKTYQSGQPDPVRRIMIESLYRKVNGSLNGLEDKIGPAVTSSIQGPAPAVAPALPSATPATMEAGRETSPAVAPSGATDASSQPAETASEKPAAENTPAITLRDPRDAPAPARTPEITAPDPAPPSPVNVTPPQPEPTPQATPEATPATTPEPTPETKPIAARTPEVTPETKPTPEPPSLPSPTPEPTPEIKVQPVEAKPEPASTTPANMIELPMPTESAAAPTPSEREAAPATRPRVARGVSAEATPEAAYRELYAAVQSRDFAVIQQLLSTGTLTYALDLAKIQHRPFNEVIGNGFTATTAAPALPEIRGARSSGETAIIEVRNEANNGWERLPFLKEDGQWKLAVGEMKRGAFREPDEEKPPPEAKAPAPAPAETPTVAASKTEPGNCGITIGDTDLSLLNNGGRISITVGLVGSSAIDKIAVSTPNWADIAVFPQTGLRADATERVFTVSSISRNTGEYTVVVKTPCGSRELKVTVR